MKKKSIWEHFRTIPDPRVERTKKHQLHDILVIALCAVLCGAEHWTHVETFGKVHEEWFRTFLDLPHGIPSHDTFGRVWTTSDVAWLQARHDWPALGSLTAVERERHVNGECERKRHYFVSSHPGHSAQRLGTLIRRHWSLDVSFHEDASRVRTTNAAEDFRGCGGSP